MQLHIFRPSSRIVNSMICENTHVRVYTYERVYKGLYTNFEHQLKSVYHPFAINAQHVICMIRSKTQSAMQSIYGDLWVPHDCHV